MPAILFEIKNSVAVITLNRPEKFNSFNREMALLLQKLLDDCAADNTVRAIYVTGNGKAFCSGQDLGELVGENPPGFEVILAEHYNPIISPYQEHRKTCYLRSEWRSCRCRCKYCIVL
jgi:2-(1,2-epoxy-1,2-dihydrophenyl)acetyl-CoA isomerase